MNITQLTHETFDQHISNGVTIVDFYAPWCSPCNVMLPRLEEISKRDLGVSIYKVNIDESPEIATWFRVMSIPTLLFFKDWKVVHKTVGVIETQDLEKVITSLK